eukprot:TRINITY_DN682_c1_g3_i1.p1 TRINITY_DN682_c1_g3~~TRINITY_DN682_c1_g3_i1.p1  ORF type:complete len:612 (+),score=220.53 TRINITY_DN682_c1_g3_i1:82-1836(+)
MAPPGPLPARCDAADAELRFASSAAAALRPPRPAAAPRAGDEELLRLLGAACARAGGAIPLADFFRIHPEQRARLQGRRLAELARAHPTLQLSESARHGADRLIVSLAAGCTEARPLPADTRECSCDSATGRRAMRELQRVVAAELVAAAAAGAAPPRVTYVSRAWSVRRKLRPLLSIAPVPSLLHPGSPLTSALAHFHRFLSDRAEVFELLEHPEGADPSCPVPGPWCTAAVRLRDAEGLAEAAASRDDELRERVLALLAEVNPAKGASLSWVGQDRRVRKLLRGRALVPVLRQMDGAVRLWADDGDRSDTWRAAATPLGAAAARERAAVRRRGGPPGQQGGGAPRAREPLRVLCAAEGVAAVEKPWWATTEETLQRVRAECGFGQVISVSRLDKGTSGVLVFATSAGGAAALREQFARCTVAKEYLCLCCGVPDPPRGEVALRLQLGDSGPGSYRQRVCSSGKPSLTLYEVLGRLEHRGESHALLRCEPRTGRTHQIRAHLAAVGHPLVGDAKYGKQGAVRAHREWLGRLFLHCARVGARDASGAPFEARVPLTGDLAAVLPAGLARGACSPRGLAQLPRSP